MSLREVDIIRKRAEEADQGHVFRYWEELSPEALRTLLAQVRSIDFDQLRGFVALMKEGERARGYGKIEPVPEIVRLPRTALEEKGRLEARRLGEEALRSGKVAAVVVAGGQGTRLGFEGPKGALPIGPVTGRSIFQLHAEKLLALTLASGEPIPWYIMTSDANHEPIVRFFEEHRHFGLSRGDVFFFQQGMLPAVDRNGKIILDRKDHIFMSPNGHGGVFQAMRDSGALSDMRQRGIEHIFYFQVDNVLVRMADPIFLGYHLTKACQMSSKVIPKRSPEEKLGVLCLRDGRYAVVEYSDLQEEDMRAKNEDGSLKFWAGSIAIHFIERSFAESIAREQVKLPYHLAQKPIPYINERGDLVEPRDKNGVKFETFVFDALPLARAMAMEVRREEEFAPVKEARGEDSIATARTLLINEYGRWLEEAGFSIRRNGEHNVVGKIEISPLTALDASELKEKIPKDLKIEDEIVL